LWSLVTGRPETERRRSRGEERRVVAIQIINLNGNELIKINQSGDNCHGAARRGAAAREGERERFFSFLISGDGTRYHPHWGLGDCHLAACSVGWWMMAGAGLF
jgi:hypothetical protein